MALTQTQVSQLYVTLFGRVSEGAGNKYWQSAVSDVAAGANAMLATTAAQEYFGSALTSDEAFIKHIYKNTLNKTQVEDPAGIKFWVDALKAGNSRGLVVSELIKAAQDPANKGAAQDYFNNKVALSDYTATKVEGKDLKVKDLAPFKEALTKVTSNPSSLTDAKAFVDSLVNISTDSSVDWNSAPVNPGTAAELTTDTDTLTANVFNAGMKHNPGGTDRIMTLQSSDRLTGDASRADNTLNVEFGHINGDEADPGSRTPILNNVQNINIQVTGTVNTLDLRDSNDVEKVNIDRVTQEAANKFTVQSIGQKLDGMRLANVAKKDINVKFEHKKGVLAGFEDKSSVFLEKVDAKSLSITSDANTEGYEQLDLVSKQDVSMDKFEANQLRELTIKGSGSLEIADVELNAGANPQFYEVKDGGIQAVGTRGFTKLDASNYNGKLTLDISDIVKNAFDPFDSGKKQYTDIIGSKLGDTFYLRNGVEDRISINGGEGQDKLVMVGGSIGEYETEGKATITNIETLEMRAQKSDLEMDFDRFDENLKNVVVRNETIGTARTFTLNDISEKFAKEGEIVVEHAVGDSDSDGNFDTKIVANLKDAKGKDDTLNFKVVDANNKDNTFEYEIGAKGVENLKINDSDSESNSVKFTNANDHTGTITLTGGTKDLYYAVDGEVVAKTVDASAQKSDLRLTVKDQDTNPGQDIKLGTGNDVLTFAELDGLDGKDKITDAGGDNDTVRAIFSKDGALNLAGIEGIHIVASKNVTLDIVSKDVSKLVVMSQEAVAQTDKVSSLGYGVKGMGKTVDATKVITVKSSTNITELNFKGDLDKVDQKGPSANPAEPYVDEETDQHFNGVKLLDNKAESVNVNIDSKLDDIDKGAKSYTVEQITVDGTKNITVNVNDERIKKDAATVTTEIKNIAGKNLETLTLNAKRDLNLNTVTANDLNNSISLVDASNVMGEFIARVVGLGDGATVKISDGGSKFNALGSAGKGIKIAAGDGKNEITGSAQSDFITTGSANDKVYAHRGDNVIDVGDGDDAVTARDGNDTVAFGRGYDSYKDNFGTSINTVNAATTVTKLAGVANVQIAVKGDVAENTDITLAQATDGTNNYVNQVIASGEGSTLKVQWQGGQIQGSATTLNGRFAENYNLNNDTWDYTVDGTGATDEEKLKKGTGNDKDNFWIAKGAHHAKVNGGDGNDVVITAPDVTKLTFNGGNGNDAAVGTKGADVFEGGKGADVFATNNIYEGGKVKDDGATDTIKIADGESVKGSHDVIYGFSTAAAGSDKLELSSTLVADNKAAGAQDIASGQGKAIQAYGITNGVATFYSDAAHTQATVVNSKNLNDVLDYFAKELNGTTKTVAFAYDQDGDGTADSTFLFQDGAVDTVVQLAGTTGVQALGGAAGADTIVLA